MEVMIFIGALALILVVFYCKAVLDFGKRKKQFARRLAEEYGKAKKDGAVPERYANIGRYFAKHRAEYEVDDITWNDLSMDRLFHRINYAHSSCGEEYLYYRLRCPETTPQPHEDREREEKIIRYFSEHEKERVDVQMQYAQIGFSGVYSLYQYLDFLDNLGKRSNVRHYAVLILYALSVLTAIFVQPSVGIGAFVGLMIYQIWGYLKEHGENEPYLVSFAFILRFLSGIGDLTQNAPEEIRELTDAMNGDLKELQCITKHSFFMAKGNTQQGDPLAVIGDYFNMITHLNLISFNKILAAVKRKTEQIDRLYTQAGYLEYLLIVGEYRKSLPCYCIPEFVPERVLAYTQLYHPLIEKAVPCSYETARGVLVTGSNASGKSTFLKSSALGVILAQSLHTVPAKACKTSHYRVYSSMALRDDLVSGESYYMVEIRSLKRILDASGEKKQGHVLCFVDEVLRGTNTVERIAASTQIMRHFAKAGIKCFAATHDIELSHLLEKEYDNYHFEEEVADGDICFHYELKEGRATTRNAIRLLEMMGYDEAIIRSAEELAAHFMQSGAWQ